MTERTVKVTLTGTFTYTINDTSDDFDMYYGAKFVEDVDIESVRDSDGFTFLWERLMEKPEAINFELNWADEVN